MDYTSEHASTLNLPAKLIIHSGLKIEGNKKHVRDQHKTKVMLAVFIAYFMR